MKKFKMKARSNWNKLNRSKTKIMRIEDLTFPRFNIKFTYKTPDPEGITQSLIQSFLKCRRSFLYQMNKWASEGKRTNFANGSITHDTLDKVYTFYKKRGKLPSEKLIKKWLSKYDKENPNWLPTGNTDAERYKAVCFVMVTEYVKYHKADFKRGRIAGIEQVFDIKWRGYRFRGKKDLTFNIKQRRWIMETKTSGRIQEDILMLKLAFDFQNLFYVNAEEVEHKVKVAGVLYNIIRNPGLKFTDASLTKYCERLRKDVKKRPEHYFKRFEIPYTNIDKKNFKEELHEICKDIEGLLYCPVKQTLCKAYKNTRSCTGMFPCSFIKACASGELDGYIQVKSLFKELETT